MILIYPVGVPLLMLTVLYFIRDDIKLLMGQVFEQTGTPIEVTELLEKPEEEKLDEDKPEEEKLEEEKLEEEKLEEEKLEEEKARPPSRSRASIDSKRIPLLRATAHLYEKFEVTKLYNDPNSVSAL